MAFWIDNHEEINMENTEMGDDKIIYPYQCSNCGKSVISIDKYGYIFGGKYCPCCGEEMKGIEYASIAGQNY